MLELDRRERHLVGGLGLQVLVVGLLVFSYTQAARQLNVKRELCLKLREQVTLARQEIQKEGPPDLMGLRARLKELEGQLVPTQALVEWVEALRAKAQEEYGFLDVQIRPGPPERTFTVPLPAGKDPLEVALVAVELEGFSTTRHGAALLKSLSEPSSGLLVVLQSMELKKAAQEDPLPVHFRLKWLVGTSPSPSDQVRFLLTPASVSWGWREEPFLSPLFSPGALRVPQEVTERLKLTGVLWDPIDPACVINGKTLRPSDTVEGYQVLLITPRAVLLKGAQGEVLLTLS